MRRVAGDLLDTMRKRHAGGLAAIQIGEAVRVIAISPRVGFTFSVIVNPVILERSGHKTREDEGCLSIRNGHEAARFRVLRHWKIRVSFADRAQQPHELDVVGFPARVIQHEVDHLDGILIDRHPIT